jgi:hypothetical protein
MEFYVVAEFEFVYGFHTVLETNYKYFIKYQERCFVFR